MFGKNLLLGIRDATAARHAEKIGSPAVSCQVCKRFRAGSRESNFAQIGRQRFVAASSSEVVLISEIGSFLVRSFGATLLKPGPQK